MRPERDDTETRCPRGLVKGDVRGVVEVVLGEHLLPELAPRTIGPRDVPRCGLRAYSKGRSAEFSPELNENFWVLPACLRACVLFKETINFDDLRAAVLLLLRQRRSGLVTTIKYLRRTTSAAAGNGLGTTIKYLRRTTSAAAGNGLGTTIKYPRRTASGAAGYGWAPRPSTCAAPRYNELRRGQRPEQHDQIPAVRAVPRAFAWAPR
jgi:hypothetical protein